jgi:hypothetical protein
MGLLYFTEDAYDDLSSNIGANLTRYASDEDWLEDFFCGQVYIKESSVDFSLPQLYRYSNRLSVEDKTKEDIINVKNLYERLKGLSPLQATNKYLWTCLSHTIYKDYVVHRWLDYDKYLVLEDQKKENRIKRTFFTSGDKRSLEAHAIARLWWYGFASYDAGNPSNPFHLTDILVANTKFCRDFMQSLCCENRTVGRGVLLAVRDFMQALENNGGISTYYRHLKKYMNRYGAVTSLDYLSEDEIRSISYNYLDGLRKKKIILEDDSSMDIDDEEDELTSTT